MANNYLCTTMRTMHPFYIESIGINVYSVEELCYYLSHYVYLIDETIINEKLTAWLGEELGLVRVQRIQKRVLDNHEGALAFLLPVFQECSYLTSEALAKFQEELNDLQVESEDERRKMKADYLVSFEMYVNAICEYEKILSKRSPGRLGIQFYAQVLENMATAYAQLFQFEEAADCLWESYQCLRSKKIYEKYLQILPLFMSKQRYEQRMEEIHANPEEALRCREDTEELFGESFYSEFAQNAESAGDEEFLKQIRNSYIRNTAGTR